MSHPNLISYFYLQNIEETEDRHIVFAVEYMSFTLTDYLEKYGIPSSQKLMNIFKQILKALSYMKTKEIIHRDIKNDNLFYDE